MADADYVKLALELGFSHAAKLTMQALTPMAQVRDMCSADRCQSFGRRWSCPPACGTLEQAAKRMACYSNGVLVQTIGRLQDDFDIEAIAQTQRLHKRQFETLVRCVRREQAHCLPLTAGDCTLCIACTYPGRPCRFPNKMISSMEAYGLLVSDVCQKSGLAYYYGPKTIAYTSCILVR